MNFQKIISFLLIVLFACSAIAQDDNIKWYTVHEDIVKPSKIMEYEKIAKELKDNLVKHDIAEAKYLAASTEDFRFMYVSAIDGMADLDNNVFKTLADKMGKENLKDLFSRMNACYDKHGSYTMGLNEELSFMPDGMSQTQKGKPYRVFAWYHTTPSNWKALSDAGKAMKDLHASKGSKLHYRVYQSGYGTVGAYFMVAISAESEADFAKMNKENLELLGTEGQKLMGKVWANTAKYETTRGMMRMDLSYLPDSQEGSAAKE